MNLIYLTDKSLLADTKILVQREREISTQILHHLKEIERRKLYSDLGHPSLFVYCMKELGYSESSASRRIHAARLLKDLPQIEAKIENGSLTMSNIFLLNQFFKENEMNSPSEKLEVLAKVENLSTKDCEKELFRIAGKPEPITKDKKKRISETKTRYSITLSDETSKSIDEVKGLLNQNLSLDELIKLMAQKTIVALKKDKFKIAKLPRLSTLKVGRIINSSTKREVYQRDQKCTQCGSTHRLQFDHRTPFALGGDSSSQNVRLLCFNCNQRARIRARL